MIPVLLLVCLLTFLHYVGADEIREGRLRTIAVERLRMRRHFHVVHDDRRPLSASARAFVGFLEGDGTAAEAPSSTGSKRPRRGHGRTG